MFAEPSKPRSARSGPMGCALRVDRVGKPGLALAPMGPGIHLPSTLLCASVLRSVKQALVRINR